MAFNDLPENLDVSRPVIERRPWLWLVPAAVFVVVFLLPMPWNGQTLFVQFLDWWLFTDARHRP